MTHIDNNAIITVILPSRSLTQLIAEEANGNITLYMYNSTGIVGFRYRTSSYAKGVWDTYLYEKNLQGDIVAVYDGNGTKKISYTYDAWGNFTATYHNGASATTLNNPYTYRGYYYDKDLSLYYLSSRYYDSNTGRFINADGHISTGQGLLGYNMFAYCGNNPVARGDNSGDAWNILVGAIVGAAINLVMSVASELVEGDFEPKDVGQIAISTTIGAVEGAAIATVPGAAPLISAVANATDTAINDAIDGKDTKTIAVNSFISGTIGLAAGMGDPDFVKGGKLINEAANAFFDPALKKASSKIIGEARNYIGKATINGLAKDTAYSALYDFASRVANFAIENIFER